MKSRNYRKGMGISVKIAVRIDDITPDMDWESFYGFKMLLDQYGIKPLIGVVPDNQDPNLRRGEQREDFWEYMKELQDAGWSIALHGAHHIYTTKKGGIFPLNHFSEFAGVSYEKQKQMLEMGRQTLTDHGIQTDIFMAPGHSYDDKTLHILSELGFRYVTDGFAKTPYKEGKSGLIFLPIAFHSTRDLEQGQGYTTLVYHLNGTTKEQLENYGKLFESHQKDFIPYESYKQVTPISQTFYQRIRECFMANLKHYLVQIRSGLKKK